MSLNIDEVRQLGALARLALDEAETLRVAGELNTILGVLDALRAVDTTGVEPMTHPRAAGLRLRADAVTEVVDRTACQQSAPSTQDGLYLVPRVID